MATFRYRLFHVQSEIKCHLVKNVQEKKISHIARERLTYDNILYTQLFIDYLKSKDVRTIKFFDEAGIKVPDVGKLYGHSPVGERCVEVIRKSESPNTTLNMLVSYEGVQFYHLVDGVTNTVEFLNFFQEEAAGATFMQTLQPVLDVGDTIVMDNLAVHHYEGGEILEDFLFENGIELVFTPVYSPDLNPIEMCFNKVKTALSHDLLELGCTLILSWRRHVRLNRLLKWICTDSIGIHHIWTLISFKERKKTFIAVTSIGNGGRGL